MTSGIPKGVRRKKAKLNDEITKRYKAFTRIKDNLRKILENENHFLLLKPTLHGHIQHLHLRKIGNMKIRDAHMKLRACIQSI